ncbi:TetR/AcrR family transcriptional regulator [Streptomyces sp. NBC_01619]|uniref:TetR/AcrR family transcriptional regulator n=1 Tax=unclassified Streptomyces TaxID=2593676 RepID=UPI002256169F|nr:MULTISPECIES: TetR/AcrR family transcriptional regulator [unclassified Streptomyces]MCX4515568.1 TetR/AcrR family transcriptional regulator [Streptomyces sp. NBC_01619]
MSPRSERTSTPGTRSTTGGAGGAGEGRNGERPSRRAEYAEATRRAVIDEARRLFSERGYFATKVDDIAAAARVSPATVYVIGGKQGLLRILVDRWSAAPEVETARQQLEEAGDPAEILRIVAALTRRMREDYGDIMRVVLATAPHDAAAAEGLALATGRYRDGTRVAARRLAELGALQSGIDVERALDILWFYFGYQGFFTLVDDNDWSHAQAEEWLLTAARQALLTP